MLLVTFLSAAFGQDPASGWMGYAVGTYPGIITYIEAKWTVGQNPTVGGAFFSPWFGIEASDNLNLIQPVNPWVGDSWEIYNEYYQWVPEYNQNSDSATVSPGDVLFGSVTYNPSDNSYTMVHTDLTTGQTVGPTTISIQQADNGAYKNYTIAYFVMEKSEWDCNQYPPDGKVVFYDIKVEYDGKQVTPNWSTGIVDDNCNCRASVLSPTSIQITWNTN
uniref:Uncharacterized protein n=1 Tax=Arcella intermedia TaxID=1963864 RepID=A0A6B2LHB7_9EUKA